MINRAVEFDIDSNYVDTDYTLEELLEFNEKRRTRIGRMTEKIQELIDEQEKQKKKA